MVAHRSSPTIAVFDSGIGGMTILAALTQRIPTARFVYFGDTANTPYGPRSAEEIFNLSSAAIEQLLPYQPNVIVIACNTVTSTSITKLREKYPETLFVGVEPAVKPAVIVSEKKKIAIAATAATLSSDSYQALQHDWASGIEVIDLPKPAWVEMVEHQAIDDAVLTADAAEIRQSGADVLVLACTHFPFLKSRLQKLLPGIMIIDSADPVAHRVARVLGSDENFEATAAPQIEWIFSDHDDAANRQRLQFWKSLLTETGE